MYLLMYLPLSHVAIRPAKRSFQYLENADAEDASDCASRLLYYLVNGQTTIKAIKLWHDQVGVRRQQDCGLVTVVSVASRMSD